MRILGKLFRKRKIVTSQDIDGRQIEPVDNMLESEKSMHPPRSESVGIEFAPPFHMWMQHAGIEELNIQEGLDQYITEFNLLRAAEPDEPVELSKCIARLKVLRKSRDKFSQDVRADLEKYIIALEASILCRKYVGYIRVNSSVCRRP